MTSPYVITIPKSDFQLKKVGDFSAGIFIDNSGSTGSQLITTGKYVLQAELSICQATNFDHVVLWNSSARLCSDIKSARPEGGTSPIAIFQNESTRKAFQTCDVVVFVTDGQIDNHSVTQFATYTKDNLNKALVICIIVQNKYGSPSQINVSVVAPLMMASNVLCLFYDGEIFYVLSSKGYIANFYSPSGDLSSYENLKTLSMKELFENTEIYEHQTIPEGCIPIRDDEKEIVAIDLNQFLNIKDVESVSNLNENDWKTLIQYGKIENKLHDFRTFVSQMKMQAIRVDTESCKSKFPFQFCRQRDEIVSQIVTLKLNQTEGFHQLSDLRRQLHEVSDQAKLEEIEYLKYVNENLHKTRHYWNTVQNLIHEQETGSYSINDFTFASNRANRARVLTANDDEHSDTIDILDHTNVPLFECAICMEQGPFVLWLKSPTNLDNTTSDFIINFPLEGNENLAGCLVANPVCGFCAKPYMNSSPAKITLYREPYSGFLPLNWSTESNRKFINYTLFQTLTGNRILPHAQMLLLSIIDECQFNWLDKNVKEYILRQMVENIYTTDTFAEEGTRMRFSEAIKEVVKHRDKLLRQPIQAVCRILNFNCKYHQLDNDTIQILLRQRFTLMCIERQCSKTKFGPEHLLNVKQDLCNVLFDTLCGIPLYDSLKKIDIDNEHLRDFLGESHHRFVRSVTKLARNMSSDYSTILPSEIVSFVLFMLTTVEVHDRPMKLYTDFAIKYRALREKMEIQWPELKKLVNGKVFGNYHTPLKTMVPSYAINLGRFSCPSKLFFGMEPLWDKDVENKRIDLRTLIDQVKQNFDHKLRQFYGSCTPNQTSGHFLLHSIVAQVLEDIHPNETTISEEMIMNCMIHLGHTAGRKGNIYADYVFPYVVVTIEDYLRLRQTTINRSHVDQDQLSRSYEYKFLSELLANGLEYDESTKEVLFDPSRLQVPHALDITGNKTNFHELRQRVQQLYIESRERMKTNIDQTCLTIEIKDFIEFEYKLAPDDLLPIWTQEQNNIVSSIVIDVDQIEQPVKYIAGLDISFVKTNDKAVASMVIFDYSTLNIVAKISVNCNMKIPYIANYLAFREAPVFMKLIDIQKEHCPHLTPQVILMDGNGVWHPRRAGIASHFGVLSGIPCFGVSKNVLYADGMTRERVEELLTNQASKEDQYVEIIGDSGNVLGLAYNVTGYVKNAVYISVGHQITLPTACEIFKSVTKYRICEPIRQADLLSREMVTKLA
ncbi:unnamed protein product [Adineta ricciae]|uniref:Endonuclease V n=1 Tax=Adineta ricciae TaxID=249248 RepID=A0A814NNN4_ADIRI|nr:unnamed protein product [Adineta ricciae]CAF1173889.1 unnamed protein product [Adineta ricciae]